MQNTAETVGLYQEIAVGQTLKIGDTVIELIFKTGRRARLKIISSEKVKLIKPAHECHSKPEGESYVTNNDWRR